MVSLLLAPVVAALAAQAPSLPPARIAAPEAEALDLSVTPEPSQNPAADDTSAWPQDPNPTRLLVGPTGRSLKRGEAYLDMYGISVPYVQVGLTDGISIGAGTPLLFPGVAPGDVFWITPKVRVFSRKRTEAAVGVLHSSMGGTENAGIVYGVVTRGTRNAAVSVGLGYTYRWGHHDHAPLVMVGGEKRVTPSAKLITENYIGRSGGFAMAGVRFIKRRLSADVGVGRPFGAEYAFIAPIIRFSYRFLPQ